VLPKFQKCVRLDCSELIVTYPLALPFVNKLAREVVEDCLTPAVVDAKYQKANGKYNYMRRMTHKDVLYIPPNRICVFENAFYDIYDDLCKNNDSGMPVITHTNIAKYAFSINTFRDESRLPFSLHFNTSRIDICIVWGDTQPDFLGSWTLDLFGDGSVAWRPHEFTRLHYQSPYISNPADELMNPADELMWRATCTNTATSHLREIGQLVVVIPVLARRIEWS
jgi:hypothetical protein